MDAYKLEYEIKKAGYTIQGFCKELGISRSAYYKKRNGVSEFTQSEIQKIVWLLKLETPVGIFFAEKVS